MQEREFVAILSRLAKDLFEAARVDNPDDKTKPWTKVLKRMLKSYGDGHNFTSEYTNPDEGISEFMVDFLWWDKHELAHQRMVLAVESEWHNFRLYETNTTEAYATRVATDFYKLMVVKSQYKLMIFDSKSSAMRDAVIRRLNECIAEYADHRKGELYFLLDFGAMDEVTSYRLGLNEDGSAKSGFTVMQL